jgi:diaminopimelate epimerase
MEISFTKMHGLGNDFILIDCRDKELPDAAGFAKKYCRRRLGIGADQILLLYRSDAADFKMKIFNADGGEVEMCGNGIRCLAKYIWDRKLSDKGILEIETLAGIIKPAKSIEDSGELLVSVDMGEPIFEPESIPVNINQKSERIIPIIDYPLHIKDREFRITCVSMGNPHAVIFLDEDISNFPVTVYGPEIEHHPVFPKRTNVEFVNIRNREGLSMRVWERGSGETMACGTGASAAGIAAMLKGLTDRKVAVYLTGGCLVIEWTENNHVYMTGPATEVFEGKVVI